MPPSSEQPPSKVAEAHLVLLGASNLTLALPIVLGEIIRRFAGTRLDVWVAHGPGRSYGVDAGIGTLRFTALSRCGLVEELRKAMNESGTAGPVWALLTDLGNDIPYGHADELPGWATSLSAEFGSLGASVAATALPIESVGRMPRWKFQVLRRIYFPFRPITPEKVAIDLAHVTERITAIDGCRVLPTRTEWYGRDHFHLARRHRRTAFRAWLDELLPEEHRGVDGQHPRVDAGWRFRAPRSYRLFRRVRHGSGEPHELAPGIRVRVF